jgi:hypothetical protein
MGCKLEVQFNCNNKTLEMNKSSDFRITSITGLEGSSYTINKSNSNQDGMVVTGKKIEPREIIISGDIKKDENETINREELISFFNPKYTGELTINRNDFNRKIEYEVTSLNFKTSNLYGYIVFDLTLECNNPLFSSIDNYGKNIALITPQFAFPFVIPSGKGAIMGYKTYKNEAVLNNDGDFETGLEMTIIATRGEVTNPKLELSNGNFMEIITSMKKGDILKINTNNRRKSVMLNGENIINKINRRSTFFSLPVGTTTIKYSSEEGYTNMDVNIYFNKKYIGV